MNDEKNLNEEAVEETAETVEETTEVEEVAAEEVVEETVEEVSEEETAQAVEEEVSEEEPAEEVAEEETAQTIEEEIEEAVEDVAAAIAGEMPEQVVEEPFGTSTEAVAEVIAETSEENAVIGETDKSGKKLVNTKNIIIAAAAVVVVAAIVVLAIVFGPKVFNKYNRLGYIDVSGRTLAEVADGAGMTVDEFIENYGLPKDMPGSTSEAAAYYSIPCSIMCGMYGMDFETFKSTLELPETITEESTWGEAEGEVRLSVYVGEDNLATFKETYELGDEITGDTQWKEIRSIVDQKARDQRIASEKAAKDVSSSTTDNSGDDIISVTPEAETDAAEETPAAE